MMERARKREGIEQQKNMSNEDMRGDDLFALVSSVCLLRDVFSPPPRITILLNEWAVVAGNFQLNYSTTVHDASERASKLVSRQKAASPQVANYGVHSSNSSIVWAPVSPQISLLSFWSNSNSSSLLTSSLDTDLSSHYTVPNRWFFGSGCCCWGCCIRYLFFAIFLHYSSLPSLN